MNGRDSDDNDNNYEEVPKSPSDMRKNYELLGLQEDATERQVMQARNRVAQSALQVVDDIGASAVARKTALDRLIQINGAANEIKLHIRGQGQRVDLGAVNQSSTIFGSSKQGDPSGDNPEKEDPGPKKGR